MRKFTLAVILLVLLMNLAFSAGAEEHACAVGTCEHAVALNNAGQPFVGSLFEGILPTVSPTLAATLPAAPSATKEAPPKNGLFAGLIATAAPTATPTPAPAAASIPSSAPGVPSLNGYVIPQFCISCVNGECPSCFGLREESCPSYCIGGRCLYCDDGYILTGFDRNGNAKKTKCSYCSYGSCKKCGGDGYVNCKTCSGFGTCRICGGDGEM